MALRRQQLAAMAASGAAGVVLASGAFLLGGSDEPVDAPATTVAVEQLLDLEPEPFTSAPLTAAATQAPEQAAGTPVRFPGADSHPYADDYVLHDPSSGGPWPSSRDEAGLDSSIGDLEQMDGRIVVRDDGAVLDGVEISGHVVIDADNVVLRNCVIRYDGGGGAAVDSLGSNFTMEGCDLFGEGFTMAGFRNQKPAGTASIVGNYFEGFSDHMVAEGGTVEFLSNLSGPVTQTATTHNDAIQILGGTNHLLEANYFRNAPADGSLPNGQVVWISAEWGVEGITVRSNLIEGGGMALGVSSRASDVVIEDNVWLADTVRYAPVHPGTDEGAIISFTDNRLWWR